MNNVNISTELTEEISDILHVFKICFGKFIACDFSDATQSGKCKQEFGLCVKKCNC